MAHPILSGDDEVDPTYPPKETQVDPAYPVDWLLRRSGEARFVEISKLLTLARIGVPSQIISLSALWKS